MSTQNPTKTPTTKSTLIPVRMKGQGKTLATSTPINTSKQSKKDEQLGKKSASNDVTITERTITVNVSGESSDSTNDFVHHDIYSFGELTISDISEYLRDEYKLYLDDGDIQKVLEDIFIPTDKLSYTQFNKLKEHLKNKKVMEELKVRAT